MASSNPAEPHPSGCGCAPAYAMRGNLPRWFLDIADESMLALARSHLRAHAATMSEHYPEGATIPCHRSTGKVNEPYGCPHFWCCSSFSYLSSYRHHYYKHIPHFAVTCCRRTYNHKGNLLHHMFDHATTSITGRLPCNAPGCDMMFLKITELCRHRKRVHPELCAKKAPKAKAGISSRSTLQVKRAEVAPYPLPGTSHKPVPAGTLETAITTSFAGPSRAFPSSHMLPLRITPSPPIIAPFSGQIPRNGSTAPSWGWLSNSIAEPYAPTPTWMDNWHLPNIRPLMHHQDVMSRLSLTSSPVVDGVATGWPTMSWGVYDRRSYGPHTWS